MSTVIGHKAWVNNWYAMSFKSLHAVVWNPVQYFREGKWKKEEKVEEVEEQEGEEQEQEQEE